MNWYRIHLGTNAPLEISDNPQNMERSYFIQQTTLQMAFVQATQAFMHEVKTDPTYFSGELASDRVIMPSPIEKTEVKIVAPPRMLEKRK